MANHVDKRGILDEEVFTYRITKDRKVFISYHGKQVTALSGSKAEAFISEIEGTEGKEAQLIMAKVTGNFKRGNEKMKPLPDIITSIEDLFGILPNDIDLDEVRMERLSRQ